MIRKSSNLQDPNSDSHVLMPDSIWHLHWCWAFVSRRRNGISTTKHKATHETSMRMQSITGKLRWTGLHELSQFGI